MKQEWTLWVYRDGVWCDTGAHPGKWKRGDKVIYRRGHAGQLLGTFDGRGIDFRPLAWTQHPKDGDREVLVRE